MEIKTIGIIGSGKMGSDIFHYLSDFNFTLKWYILFDDEKEKLQKSFHKKIARQLKHGIITEEQFKEKSLYVFSTDLLEFSDCDLIIESITEEIQLKQNLFIKLNHIVHKKCLFVSNSSSILPSQLSKYHTVTGMHFFYPVSFKKIVELIRKDDSVLIEIETLKRFLTAINKNVFEQDESNAFILNRFLLDIQLKAFELSKTHSIDYIHFDFILASLIPDFGIFEMIDQVGLQTMYNAISNYAQMDDNPNRFNSFLDEVKTKIELNIPFCNKNEDITIDANYTKYILNDTKFFIQALIIEYTERYNIPTSLLKEYLEDFCGLIV